MKEFQQRKILRRLIYSKLSILFLFIIFIFLVFSTAGVYKKSREAIRKNNEVVNELNELNTRKLYFEEEIRRLNTNTGIEEEFRDKFQITKPGERVLIIVDDPKDKSEVDDVKDDSNWFWQIFR